MPLPTVPAQRHDTVPTQRRRGQRWIATLLDDALVVVCVLVVFVAVACCLCAVVVVLAARRARARRRRAERGYNCLLYTSPSPRDGLLSRMPSSA